MGMGAPGMAPPMMGQPGMDGMPIMMGGKNNKKGSYKLVKNDKVANKDFFF